MKYAIIILSLVAAVAALPYQKEHRHIRDVSEITTAASQNIYLSPMKSQASLEPSIEAANEHNSLLYSATNAAAGAEATVAVPEVAPETSALGENGYEYRTIRKLRLRQRRDVAHLNHGYLPPVEIAKPATGYLPPYLDVPQPNVHMKITNEYLPPVKENVVVKEQTTEAVSTEIPETEAPTTEKASTEAPATQTPATEVTTTEATTTQAPTTQAPTTQPPTTEAPTTSTAAPLLKEGTTPVETAIFAEDGYHYRRPAILPDLGMPNFPKLATVAPELVPEAESEPEPEPQPQPEPSTDLDTVLVEVPEQMFELEQSAAPEQEHAYLPPLEMGVVEAEGPAGETSVLLDDGYHYRVVKSVRLF